MKATRAQVALHSFLRSKEANGKEFTLDELLSATGWKKSTFTTYLKKGQLSDFISHTASGSYEASNCQQISEIEFAKRLSQSKHLQTLGHNCKSKLAKALLHKARDNMLLALELYNRPSLNNRIDAFVMCFCTAWEQFLKAMLIEKFGEECIFKSRNKQGYRETLSLRECLDKTSSLRVNTKRNVQQIAYFRDHAVHLLMPEIQGIASRIFQSGILNFTSLFEEFTETPFLNNSHTGLLSLVGDFQTPSIAALNSAYGSISSDILTLAKTLENEVEETNDISFAVPLKVKLVFASEDDDGNVFTLAKAEDGIQGLEKALVLEKPVDRSRSHPYLRNKIVALINARLREKYTDNKLDKHLVSASRSSSHIKEINGNCFDAVIVKNNWKASNNRFHYKNDNPEIHYYSEELVDEFINKIMASPTYLSNAKRDYNRKRRKSKR